MELLITIAYIFLVRLIFFDFKLLKFNLFWKIFVFGLWFAALLTEVLFLGQFTPYSKEMFVQSYVVQMAPEYGGKVKQIFVSPNVPVKRGDPLFQMDPEPWQYKVNELQAQLAAADTGVAELKQQVDEATAVVARTGANLALERVMLQQFAEAAEASAVSKLRLEQVEQTVLGLVAQLEIDRASRRSTQLALDSEIGDRHSSVAAVLAELDHAKYNLANTTIHAPSDGFVANLQLYPGSFVRLKSPVMTFVNTEQHWIVATVPQRGLQHTRPGDSAEVAFEMCPGKVFPAEVVSVAFASGEAQGYPSGHLPTEGLRGNPTFRVRLKMKENSPECPLRFGATGLAAIHTQAAADFLVVMRQIEIRSEAFLFYLYNPF